MIDYLKKNIDNDYFDDLPLKFVKNILDLGTGTGIIAIFLELIKRINKKFFPQIYASDILENAIKCAKSNEKLNRIENKINFIQSNLFNSCTDHHGHFDRLSLWPVYPNKCPSANRCLPLYFYIRIGISHISQYTNTNFRNCTHGIRDSYFIFYSCNDWHHFWEIKGLFAKFHECILIMHFVC